MTDAPLPLQVEGLSSVLLVRPAEFPGAVMRLRIALFDDLPLTPGECDPDWTGRAATPTADDCDGATQEEG